MAENAAFSLSNMEMFLLLWGSYHIELNLLVLDCWSDKTRHVEPSHQILRNYDGHFFFYYFLTSYRPKMNQLLLKNYLQMQR